jgi:flavin-dependent dehydrogenase
LVVGGGPSGAAAGCWLAEAGHRVLILEKKVFPREKTCGDGLTPRAVRQLEDMGLGGRLEGHLRYEGLRSIAHGVTLELEWPEHPDFPSYG